MVTDNRPVSLSTVVVIAIGVNYLLSPGAATFIAAVAIVVLMYQLGWGLPVDFVRYGWPLMGLIVLGVLSGASTNPMGAVLKDGWYFAVPAIGMLHGLLTATVLREGWRIARLVMVTGGLISIVFLVQWLLAMISGAFIEGIQGLRDVIGGGYGLSALACMVAMFWYREVMARVAPTQRTSLFILTIASYAAVIVSFSRTLILGVLLALLVRVAFQRARLVWIAIFVAMVAGLGLFLIQFAGSDDGLLAGLVEKTARSLVELVPQDPTSETDLNLYWRGFESLMGLQAFLSGSELQRIFGQGFGATVDLGLVMLLGGYEFDRIPILHNGYVYLLVKTGIAGVLLYFAWLALLARRAVGAARDGFVSRAYAGRVLLSVALYIAMSTLVVTGVYNKLDGYPLTFVLGCMLVPSRSIVRVTDPLSSTRHVSA